MGRRKGWRVVRKHESYTVEEVARNQQVTKGTVRRWLMTGLPSLNEKRPCLILGGDLVDFLKGRKPPRATCKPDECYCFKCRAPRKVALGEVEYAPHGPDRGQLVALCAECTTVMYKRVNLATLQSLKANLTITIREQGERISKDGKACLNDNLQ